jgi:hypothetical protein
MVDMANAYEVSGLEEAVAAIRPQDTVAVPLGPGVPGAFIHALGNLTPEDYFTDLRVFGALLPDLYAIFMSPGVHLKSGFFGPAERFLRDAGADVDFVPADFRRFEPVLAHIKPRVLALAGAMPVDGQVSLSLHAGAFTSEINSVINDPNRVLIVECSPHFPRTFGMQDGFIEGGYSHSALLNLYPASLASSGLCKNSSPSDLKSLGDVEQPMRSVDAPTRTRHGKRRLRTRAPVLVP